MLHCLHGIIPLPARIRALTDENGGSTGADGIQGVGGQDTDGLNSRLEAVSTGALCLPAPACMKACCIEPALCPAFHALCALWVGHDQLAKPAICLIYPSIHPSMTLVLLMVALRRRETARGKVNFGGLFREQSIGEHPTAETPKSTQKRPLYVCFTQLMKFNGPHNPTRAHC